MNENRIIWSAFILSLLLHLVLAGILWRTPISVEPVLAQPNEVELLLVPDSAPQSQRFVLIPERVANNLAPENPNDPIAASLFNSRAADEIAGGTETTPSARKQDDDQKVEIRKDHPDGAEGVAVVNQPLLMAPKQSRGEAAGDDGTEDQEKKSYNSNGLGQWALPDEKPKSGPENEKDNKDDSEESPELEQWWEGDSPSLLKQGEQGQAGDRGFDFNQDETGQQGAGVALVSGYSMNTYDWAFGPWLQKWINQLHRHWRAPYAYSHLGMIYGKTRLRMVINRDGYVESFEILDREGHESLHEASEAAVKAFAPYAKLPDDFPEEKLVLTMELRYPALR